MTDGQFRLLRFVWAVMFVLAVLFLVVQNAAALEADPCAVHEGLDMTQLFNQGLDHEGDDVDRAVDDILNYVAGGAVEPVINLHDDTYVYNLAITASGWVSVLQVSKEDLAELSSEELRATCFVLTKEIGHLTDLEEYEPKKRSGSA